MPVYDIPFQLDAPHRRCVVGGEPMLFHCHHYNTFLQRTIQQDADFVDSRPFLVGAAAEVAFAQFSSLFARVDAIADRKRLATSLYQWAGLGTFDLTNLDDTGGEVRTENSHYAMAWRAKFGRSNRPVCDFASGWLAGTLAAIYGLSAGSFSVEHRSCSACGDSPTCGFRLTREAPNYTVFNPVGTGALTEHRPQAIPATPVDYDGILEALTGMEIVGDTNGQIPAFGVYLTRHYANYYNRISFEFERNLHALLGAQGIEVASPLLIEAGHVCAFNTFGGIMTSPEWDALIKPSLKTREDWVHGIVAAINALGWGRWQVTTLSETEAEFVIHDDYESTGYLAMYGTSDHPISYLAQGAVAGVMNLVYHGDVASNPEFTAEYYNRLFKTEGSYAANCLTSKAQGDEVTSFRVRRAVAEAALYEAV
ncbi:MAG: 4-vinyl reductase [Nannocystaceae bacterium]